MKVKYLFLLYAILFSKLSLSQPNLKTPAVISQFSDQLNADLQKDSLHGSISVVVVKGKQVIWLGAFGYAKFEKDVPADTDNIYRIGSITKTFTAALLMLLVEDGKIKLDDPVENYLPEVKKLVGYNQEHKITFRQLASHTSGLNREPDMKGADAGPLDQWEEKVLTCITKTSFRSKPGDQFWYSNIGYAILGLALSRATGVPYIQMVQQRIFAPLKMNNTFFSLPDNKMAYLAEGNSNGGNKNNTAQPLAELKGRGYKVPNGGIYSTPRDMAKFAMALTGDAKLLSAQSRKQMQEVPPGGKNYGFALRVYKDQGLDMMEHDGSVPGYVAEMAIDKSSDYAVILMRNYNIGNTDLNATANSLLKALRLAQ
jgi:CubicO group peptidase (beta-lactamase class C family)